LPPSLRSAGSQQRSVPQGARNFLVFFFPLGQSSSVRSASSHSDLGRICWQGLVDPELFQRSIFPLAWEPATRTRSSRASETTDRKDRKEKLRLATGIAARTRSLLSVKPANLRVHSPSYMCVFTIHRNHRENHRSRSTLPARRSSYGSSRTGTPANFDNSFASNWNPLRWIVRAGFM